MSGALSFFLPKCPHLTYFTSWSFHFLCIAAWNLLVSYLPPILFLPPVVGLQPCLVHQVLYITLGIVSRSRPVSFSSGFFFTVFYFFFFL